MFYALLMTQLAVRHWYVHIQGSAGFQESFFVVVGFFLTGKPYERAETLHMYLVFCGSH